MKKALFSLMLMLLTTPLICFAQGSKLETTEGAKIETNYDTVTDKTTISLSPLQIAGDSGKYHSVHMSPSVSFQGHNLRTPSIIDFELQAVVKGKLDTDLYVVFVVDGKTHFFSSNRWAVKSPVRGRVWAGERLVFRMPYEAFVKITKAKTFEIKFDAVRFAVSERQLAALREFLNCMTPGANPDSTPSLSP